MLQILAAVPGLAFSCGRGKAGPGPLRVAAASDLRGAFPVLASAFRAKSGVEAEASFGASGLLAEQIRQGAPFDVFLSADRRFVEGLARSGEILADSVRPYAVGGLALIYREGAGRPLTRLADLANPGVRFVAIANPETAPYGRAARQALARAGLLDAVGPKLVPAGSVDLAAQLVRAGEADAGIVSKSVAAAPGLKSVALQADACDPIVQCLGIVARSDRRAGGSAFVAFLLSAEGQAIFQRLGFEGAPG